MPCKEMNRLHALKLERCLFYINFIRLDTFRCALFHAWEVLEAAKLLHRAQVQHDVVGKFHTFVSAPIS